jgi:hypothetical protein
VGLRYGIKCLPHLLPKIRPIPAPFARVEVCGLMLRFIIHSSICLVIRKERITREGLWLCCSKLLDPCRVSFSTWPDISTQLWCWISIEWDFLRVAGFYGPLWLIILSTLAIYLAVGRIVFRWRRQLIRFAESHANDYDISIQSQVKSHGITKTTEIRITTEAANTAETAHQLDFSGNLPNPARSNYVRRSSEPKSWSMQSSRDRRPLHANVDANKAAIRYCKCALIFFCALLVTWVPSTVNRVATLVDPKTELFGLNYMSGLVLPLQGFWNAIIYIMTSWSACKALLDRIATPFMRTRNTRASSTNRANMFAATVDMSNSTGYGSKKQQAVCSESLEELREA